MFTFPTQSEGCSTLMMAVIEWGKSEVISQLLEAGNIDIQDKVKCRCQHSWQS